MRRKAEIRKKDIGSEGGEKGGEKERRKREKKRFNFKKEGIQMCRFIKIQCEVQNILTKSVKA